MGVHAAHLGSVMPEVLIRGIAPPVRSVLKEDQAPAKRRRLVSSAESDSDNDEMGGLFGEVCI